MRTILALFILLIFTSCKETVVEKITMQDDVIALADDTYKGRETGTDGERQAAIYIQDRFQNLGLQPMGTEGYFQKFNFKPSTDPHQLAEVVEIESDSLSVGINVIGFKDNNAETTVVIGAHYDHLGFGGEGSLHRGEKSVHNGADDNASGVAMMMHLAERIGQKYTNNNYLLIAFSGEELGLLGSNYFVKNPTIDIKKVSYMINLDMVGRLNAENTVAVHGVGTSPTFKQVLFANNDQGLNIAEKESGVGPSDFTSFYLQDIPVLSFFTGQHEDYHKPTDDSDKINFEGMKKISAYILNIIADLNDMGQLAFRKTKNESEEVPRFKVTLGVVPDYLFTGKGMRIDGVSEDRPAQKAGMQKGDVVVKMGDLEITDMMSYMKALSSFEEGQSTKVAINRSGEILVMDVKF